VQTDFSTPGINVRSVFDSAKSGHTTGRVVRHAGRDYAFVRLKSGETAQFPCEHLEPVPDKETRGDSFKNFRFAGPDQLQRAVITEKVRGRLTDVFYSMGSGHAIFYPHQFKPVLKLVSSPGGRILIADEVGLGKTIPPFHPMPQSSPLRPVTRATSSQGSKSSSLRPKSRLMDRCKPRVSPTARMASRRQCNLMRTWATPH
jgi:hypothetical protein